MKRIHKLIHFFIFSTLLVMISCGQNSLSKSGTTTSSTTSALGSDCGCNSESLPVCNIKTGATEINACVANCKKVQYTIGNCSCKLSGPVCGDNGVTYQSECVALDAIRFKANGITKIVKYADCSAATY